MTPESLSFGLSENIYGHAKRLGWIACRLSPGDRVLEIGCGTGYMITIPLVEAGWDAIGIDTDQASIDYGQALLTERGHDPNRLLCGMTEEFDLGMLDAVIISEVLEHIPTEGIIGLLETVCGLLKPDGTLIVTVPNGYGAFEVENFLWKQLRAGDLFRVTRMEGVIRRAKSALGAQRTVHEHPSSLDSSPHVQRFTLSRIESLLVEQGFTVAETTGTVLVGGPISNMFFTGFPGIMRLNGAAGGAVPALATAFMIAANRTKEEVATGE